MVFRLLSDWLAVLPYPNDLSHRAEVVQVGEAVDDLEPGDVVLLEPGAGYDVALNGKAHRIVDRPGVVGVVVADDAYDEDMRPLPAYADADDAAGEDEDGGAHAHA